MAVWLIFFFDYNRLLPAGFGITSTLLGSGKPSKPDAKYKKVVTESQNSIGLFLPNEAKGLSLTFNPL
jgi:hypothetical protein